MAFSCRGRRLALEVVAAGVGLGLLVSCRARPEPVGPSRSMPDARSASGSCARRGSAASPRHFLRFVDRSLEAGASDDPCSALDLPIEGLVDTSGGQLYVHPDGRRTRPPATCRDYLGLVANGFHDDTPLANNAEEDLHRICTVLDLLSHATDPTISHVQDLSLARDGLDALPLAVADVFDSIDPAHRGRPLSAASESRFRRCDATGPRELCLYREPESPGDRTAFTLQHVASGDFDRDGLEDMAVWASMGDGPTQEYGTRLFILTRRGPGRLLEIIAER
jgi:hypothetical protein